MDKDTRFAIISILEVSQEVTKGASGAPILTLQIHEALVKARVPATWRHMNPAVKIYSLN
jgi:hypothetical protein